MFLAAVASVFLAGAIISLAVATEHFLHVLGGVWLGFALFATIGALSPE